ncbi:MAG: type VI secretion system protein TssA [Burkholderiales bacterium]|jgi:type VI secretion system protein ImpA
MTIEALLLPISDAAPAGSDLAFSPAFDAIAEMRREDDPTLSQGDWVTELKVADWPGVIRECEGLLKNQSKDLRVAGWWADAAARVHGIQGLADGLLLNAELLGRFWDHVHPMLDHGDAEERIGNLSWLLTRIEALAHAVPVVQIARQRLGLRDVEAARLRAAEPTVSGDERPTLVAIQRAVAQLGSQAFDTQLNAMQQAQEALQRLQAEADARFGRDGPGFAGARKALEAAMDALKRLGRDSGLGTSAAPVAADETHDSSAPAGAASAPVARVGALQTRAQALQQLHEVAAYFRRTEPHSPVAYLAEKAARWGDLPLHAWLRQVVKDDATLARLDDLLGVEPPSMP